MINTKTNQRKGAVKLLAYTLAFVMLFASMPLTQAFAAELDEYAPVQECTYIPEQDIAEDQELTQNNTPILKEVDEEAKKLALIALDNTACPDGVTHAVAVAALFEWFGITEAPQCPYFGWPILPDDFPKVSEFVRTFGTSSLDLWDYGSPGTRAAIYEWAHFGIDVEADVPMPGPEIEEDEEIEEIEEDEEVDLEIDEETEADADVEAEVTPEAEADTEVEAEATPESDENAGVETEATPEVEEEAEVEIEAETEVEAEIESDVEAEEE